MSAVSVQVEVPSRDTCTVPAWVETTDPLALVISPDTAPVKAEPSVSSSVNVALLPTSTRPSRVCPLAFRTAVFPAPVQPSSQTERSTFPLSSLTIFTPLSVMTALVLVTWNTWPLFEVRLPPVMVKAEVPLSASPDMDW